MLPTIRHASILFGFAILASVAVASASGEVVAPMVCDHGPEHQNLHVIVTAPSSIPTGETFTVRLDGVPSGTISSIGLHFVHDMTVDYVLAPGAVYVEGSVEVVPRTGTENVRSGARVVRVGNVLRLMLPAQVEEGSSYTPPSIEFRATATGAKDERIVIGFSQFRITANAVVVGDVKVVCNPTPKPFPLASIRVEPGLR